MVVFLTSGCMGCDGFFLGAIGVRTMGYVVNQGVYGCGPAVLWVLPSEFWSRWWFEREEDV